MNKCVRKSYVPQSNDSKCISRSYIMFKRTEDARSGARRVHVESLSHIYMIYHLDMYVMSCQQGDMYVMSCHLM